VILVDTNVVSELVRLRPEPTVEAFLLKEPRNALFTAAVCVAEIRYGLARMPAGRRRDELATRIETFLTDGFEERILPFDAVCAALYGAIRAEREARGGPIEVEDAMIAATARAHGAAVATRNVADFEGCGIDVINPWEHGA
jgi:predicted nucleic acid-binding protein